MKTRMLLLVLVAVIISETYSAPVLEPTEYVTIEERINSPDDIDDVIRIKRSGSGDIFGYIKKGITSKISQFAQASAGASAHFSGGSSGGSSGGGGGGYYYPNHDMPGYGTKSFDFWALKKSILNTLLQAVKAIKGGVIAVKGQLIKGGGAIISAKGKIISMKGEAIASLGRHIITSAKLSPSPYISHPTISSPEYTAPTGHSGPSAPEHPSPSYGPPSSEYGAPSASGPTGPSHGFSDLQAPPSSYGSPTTGYGPPIGPSAPAPSQAYLPQKLNNAYEELRSKLPAGAEAGIVILRKIPPKSLDLPHGGVATLPLQDERNKVVNVPVPDYNDIGQPNLFQPLPPDTKPFKVPNLPPYSSNPPSLFESTLNDAPQPYYGGPLELPTAPSGPGSHSLSSSGPGSHSLSSSGPGSHSLSSSGPGSHSLPSIAHSSNNSPPSGSGFSPPSAPSLDLPQYHDSNPNNFQSDFNPNSQSSYQYGGAKPPNHNNYKNKFVSKIPTPFEINTFGSNFPNTGFSSSHNTHSSSNLYPSTNSDLTSHFNSYAPAYNLPAEAPRDSNSYSVSSNLQYKHGISEHPQFDILKSVSYELPAIKRQ